MSNAQYPQRSTTTISGLAASLAALVSSGEALAASAIAAGGYVPQVQIGQRPDDPGLPEGFALLPNAQSGVLELAHTSHRSHSSHASHASASSPGLPRPVAPSTPRSPSEPYTPSAPSTPSRPSTPYTPLPATPRLSEPVATSTILEALAKTHKHDILLAALKSSGLDKALQASGTLTLLAPTDDAFRALPASKWEAVCKPEHKDELTKLLRGHVFDSPLSLTALKTTKAVTTLDAHKLLVEPQGTTIIVGGAKLLASEERCTNGVLLQTDRVLLSAAGNLLVVMDTRGYATMAGLLRTAGMESVLSGYIPYTVFVPTDEAFKKLPAGTLDRLRLTENKEELKAFLNHHIVRGRCTVKSLLESKTVRLNDDKEVGINSVAGVPQVGGVPISMLDDEAANGYLQRIDTVIPRSQQ